MLKVEEGWVDGGLPTPTTRTVKVWVGILRPEEFRLVRIRLLEASVQVAVEATLLPES